MQVDAATGLVLGIRQVLSPHFDARQRADDISLIVIHGISLPPGGFGGPHIEQFFTGNLRRTEHPYFEEIAGQRVSAHLLVRRDGQLLQFVAFNKRAWHAGTSSYAGRDACNDFSIGIELEGTDELPYEAAQYAALDALIPALLAAYPTLSSERIVGHSDIAPGRKTDPGPRFDWTWLRS
ncbi:MAG: 1,6-anhydro-N-acetylmuramyl-L-alanine amidase AmpD [Steroidobacteraceae bacterium]